MLNVALLTATVLALTPLGCGAWPTPVNQLSNPRFDLEGVSVTTGRVTGRLSSDDGCFSEEIEMNAFGLGTVKPFIQTVCDRTSFDLASARFSLDLGPGAAQRILLGEEPEFVFSDEDGELSLQLPALFLPFEATVYEGPGAGTEADPARFEVGQDLVIGAEAITSVGTAAQYFAAAVNTNGAFSMSVRRATNPGFLRLRMDDLNGVGIGLMLMHEQKEIETFDCGGGTTCSAETGQISTSVHVVIEEDPDRRF